MKIMLLIYFKMFFLNLINKISKLSLYLLILSSYCHAQKNINDSVINKSDSITKANGDLLTHISINNSTKIYIVKGTVTKNIENRIKNPDDIVYINPKESLQKKKAKNLDKVKVVLVKEKQAIKLDQFIKKKKHTEKKKVNSLPYHNKYVFYTYNRDIISLNNSFQYFVMNLKATYSLNLETIYDYIYKPQPYHYIFIKYSKCLSTLEIRSPSQFI